MKHAESVGEQRHDGDAECPICHSGSASFCAVEAFDYLRCDNRACRHVWLQDIPTAEELNLFYSTAQSTMWNSGAFTILEDYCRNPNGIRRYFHRDRIRHLPRPFVNKLRNRNTRALDIGCSSGVFLATLRDMGLDVIGQDIASEATSAGQKRLDLQLINRPLEHCEFKSKSDLVTCYDVIEHWRDPRELVRNIRTQCADNAAVVIRTPNHASWLRAITGRRWLWYIPPAHIHLFSPLSLTKLLRQEGFRVLGVRTGASTYLYFLAYYFARKATGAGSGDHSLIMPRWKEAAIFGFERAIRIVAAPLLMPGHWLKANPLLEVYAEPV